jgi:hypothetical protein
MFISPHPWSHGIGVVENIVVGNISHCNWKFPSNGSTFQHLPNDAFFFIRIPYSIPYWLELLHVYSPYGAVPFSHLSRARGSWNTHKCGLSPSSFRSYWDAMVSFIPRIISTTFSHTFFMMCMTSKQSLKRSPCATNNPTM